MSPSTKVALIVLCGSPASGKTMLATTLRRLWTKMEIKVMTISVDDLQTETSYSPSDWHNARKAAAAAVEEALRRKSEESVVILDDVMEYRSMRRQYYVMAADHQSAFRLVHVTCPLDVTLTRNRSRIQGRVPEHVMIQSFEKFQSPDGTRIRWERDTFVFDSVQLDARSEDDCAHLAEDLLKDWHPAEKGPIASEMALRRAHGRMTNENGLHQLDVKLRSMISQTMKMRQLSMDVRTRLADDARRLNDCRLRCLSDFRIHSKAQTNIDAVLERFQELIESEMTMP